MLCVSKQRQGSLTCSFIALSFSFLHKRIAVNFVVLVTCTMTIKILFYSFLTVFSRHTLRHPLSTTIHIVRPPAFDRVLMPQHHSCAGIKVFYIWGAELDSQKIWQSVRQKAGPPITFHHLHATKTPFTVSSGGRKGQYQVDDSQQVRAGVLMAPVHTNPGHVWVWQELWLLVHQGLQDSPLVHHILTMDARGLQDRPEVVHQCLHFSVTKI